MFWYSDPVVTTSLYALCIVAHSSSLLPGVAFEDDTNGDTCKLSSCTSLSEFIVLFSSAGLASFSGI